MGQQLFIHGPSKERRMKAVVIYETNNTPIDEMWSDLPRHKVLIDEFAARGEVIGIGAFTGGREGSMGIFKDRAAAGERSSPGIRSCWKASS